MFGIGMPEMILIMAVALIVIGPKKLPELAKSLGKALGEFKKATQELKESIAIDDEIDDAKKTFQDVKQDLQAIKLDDTDGADGVDEPILTQHTPSESEEGAPAEPKSGPGETEGSLKDV